jgi:hypothetical protein
MQVLHNYSRGWLDGERQCNAVISHPAVYIYAFAIQFQSQSERLQSCIRICHIHAIAIHFQSYSGWTERGRDNAYISHSAVYIHIYFCHMHALALQFQSERYKLVYIYLPYACTCLYIIAVLQWGVAGWREAGAGHICVPLRVRRRVRGQLGGRREARPRQADLQGRHHLPWRL